MPSLDVPSSHAALRVRVQGALYPPATRSLLGLFAGRAAASPAQRSERGQRVEDRGGFGADRAEIASAFGHYASHLRGRARVVIFEAAIKILPRYPGQRASHVGARAQRSARQQHRDGRVAEVSLPIRGIIVGPYLAPVGGNLDAISLGTGGGDDIPYKRRRIVIGGTHPAIGDRAH